MLNGYKFGINYWTVQTLGLQPQIDYQILPSVTRTNILQIKLSDHRLAQSVRQEFAVYLVPTQFSLWSCLWLLYLKCLTSNPFLLPSYHNIDFICFGPLSVYQRRGGRALNGFTFMCFIWFWNGAKEFLSSKRCICETLGQKEVVDLFLETIQWYQVQQGDKGLF